jgi:hypothetical protein
MLCVLETGDTEMEMTFTKNGKQITVYAAGEQENINGEPCYIVSKVKNSPFVFLARKSECQAA